MIGTISLSFHSIIILFFIVLNKIQDVALPVIKLKKKIEKKKIFTL